MSNPFPNPIGWEVSYQEDGMTPTGWRIRRDNEATSDPWIGSNLDHCATVFGRDRAEVEQLIAAYEGQRAINAQWLQRTGSR